MAIAIGSDPSFSKDIEALATTLEGGSGGQIVAEFARQVAEAHLDLVPIRELRAERFVAAFGNPEAKLQDYSELDENLPQLERYERRAFSRTAQACSARNEQTISNTFCRCERAVTRHWHEDLEVL